MPASGGRGKRRAPAPGARGLDLSGICGGPGFIGPGLEALRRVRRVAAILRGELLKRGETCGQPAEEREPARRGPNRCDGGNGRSR